MGVENLEGKGKILRLGDFWNIGFMVVRQISTFVKYLTL